MKYTEEQINTLRDVVGKRLSQKRFEHTLGVEKMAVLIGEKCLPERIDSLRAAALLHDISKEYSEAEHFELAKKHNIVITEAEISEPALWHSLTAAAVVVDEFTEYAEPDVLSAVYNHTVGSSDMSVFDEIILLSDYIEEGRKYERCIELRQSFLLDINNAKGLNESLLVLHEAVVKSLDNNIQEFISRGKDYHIRTKLTRDAILAKTERLKMEITKDLIDCTSEVLAREAVKILLEKKAIDVKLFNVKENSSITDYYINVTGRSTTQVASLADEVDYKLGERGRSANRTEGKRGNSWILVDFGDVIINVFDRASREFYNLDKHFSEENMIDISDLVAEVDAKLDINKN